MKRRTVSIPDGVDMHFWRWVRKASTWRADGTRGSEGRVREEDFLGGTGEAEEGIGSPVGRSAMEPPVADAASLDILCYGCPLVLGD
jgi:hypothetical protein